MISNAGRRGESVRAPTREQRLEELKRSAADLEARLNEVRRRIDRLADQPRLGWYAAVNPARCTRCRICERVCPHGAVRVTDVARVDVARCTGCGTCAQYCPQGAIRLTPRQETTRGVPRA